MKKFIIIIIVFQMGALHLLFAQTLTNNGAPITINNGSTLTIKGHFQNLDDGSIDNSGDIDISGSWINNSTSGNLLEGTSGNVHFNGATTQIIGGSSRTWFSGLHLQTDIILNVETSASTGLLLDGASLDINGQLLIMQSGSFLSGADASNYIIAEDNGRLIREAGNTNVLFPVGTHSSYNPVTINNSGTADFFGINVFSDVLDGGTSGSTIPEINNCVDMTWDIIELSAGGSDLTLTAQWNASDEGASFDRTHCGLGHYTGGLWDPQAAAAASGTDPYSITRSGITNLSAFAVGDINSPMAIVLDLIVDVVAFLEGPFNGSKMNTDLTGLIILPLTQPYNTEPWNYTGTESVVSVPNPDIVDWVLIELRDATDAVSALPETIIAQQAAFILNNGSIVSLDGSSNLQFNNSITQQLFVVVWHRNHLGIMSANPVTESGGVYTYDFTTPAGQAYGTDAQKNLVSGIYGMYGGDADAGGIVNTGDKTLWTSQAGTKGYKSCDFNMNGQVNNPDKNDVWVGNIGAESQVPE